MTFPPELIVVAGPNGAGKSTTAAALLPAGIPYVNADDIAATLSGPGRDIDAGRRLLDEWDRLQAGQQTFAIETTLASRTLCNRIDRMRESGWRFVLNFLWLPSSDISVERVAERVRLSGHNIPEPTIRRRYTSGLRNFLGIYQRRADRWRVYDASSPQIDALIAEGRQETVDAVHDRTAWDLIRTSPREARWVREEPSGYSDAHETVARMNQLIRLAVQRHKRAGVPICGWKDGRLVIIQPEDIPEYPDEPDEICEMPLSSSIDNR